MFSIIADRIIKDLEGAHGMITSIKIRISRTVELSKNSKFLWYYEHIPSLKTCIISYRYPPRLLM